MPIICTQMNMKAKGGEQQTVFQQNNVFGFAHSEEKLWQHIQQLFGAFFLRGIYTDFTL